MNGDIERLPENSVFNHQFDLLKLELELVDKAIRQHDEITKSIKNWAIVTWTASMGAALSQPGFYCYLWVVAGVPLLFWSVDALFRRIQTTFIDRTDQIARYINSAAFEHEASSGTSMSLPLMQMRCKPGSRGDWTKQYLHIARYFSIAALYVGLATLSVVVWLVVYVLSLD